MPVIWFYINSIFLLILYISIIGFFAFKDFVGFNEDWGENVHSGDTGADEFEKEGNLQVDEGSSKDDPNFSQVNSFFVNLL